MTALLIRSAAAADHATYARLVGELGVDDPVFPLDRFVGEMMATTLIAERGDEVLGYGFFRPTQKAVHLVHLVTAPSTRGQGVGRALMAEVIRRARAAGLGEMTLNVRPGNTPAIRLYESFGLRHAHTNHGLRMPWAVIDALSDASCALAEHAREIAPEEDSALEAELHLPSGALASHRPRSGRVLRRIRHAPGLAALAVFDVGFPGAYPFRAPDELHALSLLRALRPFAREEDNVVNIMVEDRREVAEALVRAGATLKLETSFMRGSIA